MKDQQVACILLALAIVGFGYGAQTFYTKLTLKKQEASEGKAAAMAAQQSFVRADRGLKNLMNSTADLREFHDAWAPYLRTTQSPQSTEQRVIDLVKQAEVFAVSQRFELLDQRDNPLFKHILRAHLTIEDEYSKALNWMASVEETLPTSRISSCLMKRGESGDDIHLELILDLPVADKI